MSGDAGEVRNRSFCTLQVAAGSLRIEGEVKGTITAEKEVSLSAQGRVEANIQATSITLAGQVKGNLAADAS
jgi:cytoskeletal protein CcmA (bactofilin family)